MSFELKILAALVDPRIKHDRVRWVVEVALAHWFDMGVRGTSAGGGGSGVTVLGMGGDVLGNLAGSGRAGGVGFGRGFCLLNLLAAWGLAFALGGSLTLGLTSSML